MKEVLKDKPPIEWEFLKGSVRYLLGDSAVVSEKLIENKELAIHLHPGSTDRGSDRFASFFRRLGYLGYEVKMTCDSIEIKHLPTLDSKI